MTTRRKFLTIVGISFAMWVAIFCIFKVLFTAPHQYQVSGYSHAVVICIDGGAMLTVNAGHYADVEALQAFTMMSKCK